MQKTYYIKNNYLKTFARIESVCTLGLGLSSWIMPGGGSSKTPLEWKFLRGGGLQTKKPSVGGVWIFSGTTH